MQIYAIQWDIDSESIYAFLLLIYIRQNFPKYHPVSMLFHSGSSKGSYQNI